MPTSERWRPVVGYEACYSVSSIGRVRRDGAVMGACVGRILRPNLDVDGYPYVCLSIKNTQKKWRLHTLVARAFIGPRPKAAQIDHVDGAKENNALENLEYVSIKENHRRASALGLKARGERQGNSVLTEEAVRQIRRLRGLGVSCRTLAVRFGVQPPCISKVVSRRTWKHVTGGTH